MFDFIVGVVVVGVVTNFLDGEFVECSLKWNGLFDVNDDDVMIFEELLSII